MPPFVIRRTLWNNAHTYILYHNWLLLLIKTLHIGGLRNINIYTYIITFLGFFTIIQVNPTTWRTPAIRLLFHIRQTLCHLGMLLLFCIAFLLHFLRLTLLAYLPRTFAFWVVLKSHLPFFVLHNNHNRFVLISFFCLHPFRHLPSITSRANSSIVFVLSAY